MKRFTTVLVLVTLSCSVAACAESHTVTRSSGSTSTTRPVVYRSAVYRWGDFGSNGYAIGHGLQSNVPKIVNGIAGTVVQIATSNSDSYALTSNGTVWAWGLGQAGQLGIGKTTAFVTTAVEVHFPAGVSIASLPDPMPFDTAMAIDTHGNVWGWGYDGNQELCLSTPGVELVPKELPLTDVTLATGAGYHALFYSNHQLYACGYNQDGELGDGTTVNTASPTAVVGLPDVAVKALVSSWQDSGALMANGSYYDWGFDESGQLGDGRTVLSSVPVRVSLPTDVVDVSLGGSYAANGQTIAILSDGTVWAWGNDQLGQLGTRARQDALSPVQIIEPSGVTFVHVSSGGQTSYAIDSKGELWAWGENYLGQVGNGGKEAIAYAEVPTGIALTQVSSTSNNVAGFYKGSPGG